MAAGEDAPPQRDLVLPATPVLEVTEPAGSTELVGSAQTEEPAESAGSGASEEPADATAVLEEPVAEELLPGVGLVCSSAEHSCQYAGTLLICAAAQQLGLDDALTVAGVARPEKAAYPARVAMLSMLSAWSAGMSSIEAMQERDARSMGVVLGLERSPSVSTLHRAIGQMLRVCFPS